MPYTFLFGVVLLAPGLSEPPLPVRLTIETGRSARTGFVLAGRDSSQQLLVAGISSSGLSRDLTRQVQYQASPEGIVQVDAAGLVMPVKEGKATIRVKGPGGISATTSVTVKNLAEEPAVHFHNQVVPILTRFGCNSGACHGKATGQNGFKLSLFGFEPEEDYEFIVREGRGRRVTPVAPDSSLLLRKAAGLMAHGGGKRIAPDSASYRILRRWIEQGMPSVKPDAPRVVRIEVLPGERILERKAQQQLLVLAHHSDGTVSDVTRITQFEANQAEMAEASPTGLIAVKELSGSATIMARYQSFVGVFRATVPRGAPVTNLPSSRNFVDELVFNRLKQLGLPPSALCDDSTFLRRVTIDVAGRLPTREETEKFLAETAADKDEKLIDRLLASKEYADTFANKWSAILRNRRRGPSDNPAPTFAFHAWIRDNLGENKPYDRFVREVLTATGEEVKEPPVIWYREVRDESAQLEDTAQLFLGQRIGCAKCHHHPFEKWSQQDYYGLAAFFSRLNIQEPPPKKPVKKGQPAPPSVPFRVSHNPGRAQAVHLRTGKPVAPAGLGGSPMEVPEDVDPRTRLVDWMVAPNNPFFARMLVNRYWKHFFGRGLVDPEDDLRLTNPPSNPELLDALAREFVQSKYDLKKLVRTLCLSRVYRLSSIPNQHNAEDRQNFSRFLPRRLNAEVLLDAVDDVTLVRTSFKGVPEGTRAVQLPDNQFDSYFLSVFGRPDSASACECERKSDASLAQCLHMFNSTEILEKVGSSKTKAGSRAAALAKDRRASEDKLRELYLVALSRPPSAEEMQVLLKHVEKRGSDVQGAWEDIVWALLNTKEFLFNH